jgi:hypothetical protein
VIASLDALSRFFSLHAIAVLAHAGVFEDRPD